MHIWKFELDNESYVVKLKENENSPNVQFIINGQIYKYEKSIKYIFDVKLHQFTFLKPKNEANYKFYIDTICFDDLMPNNKKPKENIFEKPMLKTFKIKKQNYNIDNINELINKNNDKYFSNKIEKEEEEEEKRKPIYQGGINFLLECLKRGNIKESDQGSDK